MTDTKQQAMSIDDILQSVRNAINEQDSPNKDDSPCEELELTNVAENTDTAKVESFVSSEAMNQSKKMIQDFVESAETLGKEVNIPQEKPGNPKSIESFVLELMKPQIKEWLDANLPIIVKQIVSDEIKKLVADVNKNSK